MQDIELVLRFVALYTVEGAQPGEKNRPGEQNLDDFLNETVEKRCASWDEKRWGEIEAAFYRALDAGLKIFKKFAFRKFSAKGTRGPINRSLFETEMVLLALRDPDELAKLANRSEMLINGLAELLDKDDFANALVYATGRGASSNKRLELLGALIDRVLNA